MNAIRATETRYKGYRFRSRLEARWAVFFGTLGLRWDYEPEGFVTSADPYLPDFRVWTPQGEPIWYEVKPEHVKKDAKFSAFCEGLAPDLFELVRATILSGDPVSMLGSPDVSMCPRCGLIERGAAREIWTNSQDADDREHALYCVHCDAETPSGGGHPTEPGVLGLDFYPRKGWIIYWPIFLEQVTAVAQLARAARFEHGERG